MTNYLTKEEVIAINFAVIKKYSPQEMYGVLNTHLLESAIARPQQSVFGEDAYKDIFQKAFALFESLVQNHAFHNANKRTAFAALTIFLLRNGYDFEMDSDKAVEFTVAVATHDIPFELGTAILRLHSKPMKT